MALTPTAAWLEAAERSPNEPRVLLSIYDGTNTWRAVDAPCGHSDFASDDVALLHYDPLSEEVDPFTRKTQIGSLTIEVADAWIRPILVSNRLWGQRVTIKLGWRGIAESDFISMFTGAIEREPKPRPGNNSVLIECVDALTILARRKIVGYWVNKHPLEIAEDLLESAGLSTALIDYDSLDPSGVGHEVFSGIGYDDLTKGGTFTDTSTAVFVVTIDGEGTPDTFAWTKDGAGGAAGVAITGGAQTLSDGVTVIFGATTGHTLNDNWTINCSPALREISHFNCSRGGGRWRKYDDFVIRNPTSAFDLLEEIAMMLNGMWARNEDGQVTFLHFDATVAAVDHWDDDVIQDFEQLSDDDNLVNDFTVVWQRNRTKEYTQQYRQADTDSQSNYAFPGTSERIVSEKIEVDWLDHTKGQLAEAMNAWQSHMEWMQPVHGLTGCRWPYYGVGSQPLWAQVDTTIRPGYFLIKGDPDNDEIIRALYITPHAECFYVTRDPDTDSRVTHGPYPARAAFTWIGRGQLGTPASAHSYGTPVYDITIPYYMASRRIERFGAGAAKVEVTVPLSKAWVQYGDLVTLEHSPYLAYGKDGLVAGDGKWEVTLKEVVVYGDPHCRFILTYAGVGSPTVSHESPRVVDGSISEDVWIGLENEEVAVPYVAEGLETTQDSGLDGTISSGTMSIGVVRAELADDVAYSFEANKDTYITFDQASAGLAFHATTIDSGRPAYASTEYEIAKVITDGSSITTIDTSQKSLAPISGVKVINGTTGIIKLDLAQQYGGPLNANAALTMYSDG